MYFSESELSVFLFLDPTWAESTSVAPWVLNRSPVQFVTGRVDVLKKKEPIGRLRSKRKLTGTPAAYEWFC